MINFIPVNKMTTAQLTNTIKKKIKEIGFHKTGIAPIQKLPKSDYLKEWLQKGCHGKMHWMESYLEKRLDVTELYPEAQSIIVAAHNYYTPIKHSDDINRGKISRYAWGGDYHKIIKKKLKQLLREIMELDNTIEGRIFVDTGPIQDKLWAEAAGIGWQGKNTNIISREFGSWFFLGELVINKKLIYDEPAQDYCGACTACIDACPTQALKPYRLDAARCISYLTIEYRGESIPEQYKSKLNNWIFGCDICQDVCPWNKFSDKTGEDSYQPLEGNVSPLLRELLKLSKDDFNKRFKKSPVSRAKYENFIRNVRAVIKHSSEDFESPDE
jgi:epoxyqueuosine reductase